MTIAEQIAKLARVAAEAKVRRPLEFELDAVAARGPAERCTAESVAASVELDAERGPAATPKGTTGERSVPFESSAQTVCRTEQDVSPSPEANACRTAEREPTRKPRAREGILLRNMNLSDAFEAAARE